MIHRFAFPTTIHFGAGARALVAEHLKAQGIKRPLIVTDRGIAPLPMLKGFIADLPLIPLYRRMLTWAMHPDISVAQWPNDVLELRFVQIGEGNF